MKEGKLLVAERLGSLGESRLQKRWRYSSNEVLRAVFRLCPGGSLAEAQDRHEAEPHHENKPSHRAFSVNRKMPFILSDNAVRGGTDGAGATTFGCAGAVRCEGRHEAIQAM